MQSRPNSISKEEAWTFIVAEPLLSYFFLRSDIEESAAFKSIAAVSVSGGRVKLRLNTSRFEALPSRQKIAVLVHEYLHVLLQHCTGRLHYKSGVKALKENYAMDMAINQMVRKVWELPPGVVYHDSEAFGFEPGLSAEEYFICIDNKYTDEEFEKTFGSDRNLDEHDGWGNATGEDKSAIKEMVRAYSNSHSRNDYGETLTASNNYHSLFESLLSTSTDEIKWQYVVRYFIKSVKSSESSRSFKRPSRRFGFPTPGRVPKYKSRIAAIVDTSSSMTPALLSNIGGNLNQMARSAIIDVIMCDTVVGTGGILKRFKPSKELAYVGRGATDLQPAFDCAEAEKYKAIVCFTDGHFYTSINSKIPVLWVCINNKRFAPNFGKIIHVNWKEG